MRITEPFDVIFIEDDPINVQFVTDDVLYVNMGEIQRTGFDPVIYRGLYEATPSNVEQVFSTNEKMMIQNFIVNPIPSNYGLITWNGSTLLVT